MGNSRMQSASRWVTFCVNLGERKPIILDFPHFWFASCCFLAVCIWAQELVKGFEGDPV